MKRFNEWIAVNMTLAFGTIWAFYLFVIYGLTPLMWPHYMNTILYWSNFLQLIALPALMLGQNILGRSSDKRAQETHDAVMTELADLKRLHAIQTEELSELKEVHKELRDLLG